MFPGSAIAIFLCFVAVSPAFIGCKVLAEEVTCSGIVPLKSRPESISITDFGGVGDGKKINTKAFREAIYRIEHLKREGGTLLHIPAGVFLTESFNLTSHMTLYLAKGAVIKASKDTQNWVLVSPLPSFGHGRELPGGRYVSLIHANGLDDVIITGENGTIDGQGDVWWNMFRRKTLLFTRPNLIEFMHSTNILISNITLKNSPFWNIHPVYCSNVVVRHVTVVAPLDSPNTDGVDPDSSTNVCIEDSYMSTGDDLVAVKSGWDQYGISYARPSQNITVRRLTGSTLFAGIAIGSELSGGVANVLAENISLFNVTVGFIIKTNIGRGGLIQNITFSDVYMEDARTPIKIASKVGGHPDNGFDPNALTVLKGITIKNVNAIKVTRQAGMLQGFTNAPFNGLCFSNINLQPNPSKNITWQCSAVSGVAVQVTPLPCPGFTSTDPSGSCAVSP